MTHVYLLETDGVVVQNYVSIDDAFTAGKATASATRSFYERFSCRFVWKTSPSRRRWDLFIMGAVSSEATTVAVRSYHL